MSQLSQLSIKMQKQRQKYKQRIRQQQTKIWRRQIQQGLMKSLSIYSSYHQQLYQSIKQQNWLGFYNILEDILGQPTYLHGLVSSCLLKLFIQILQINDKQVEQNTDQNEQKEQLDLKQTQQYSSNIYLINDYKLKHQIIIKILQILSNSFYDTSQQVKILINTIWKKLNSSQLIEIKMTLIILSKILKELPQFHTQMLKKGLAKQLCQFIQQEIENNNHSSLEQQQQEQNSIFIKSKWQNLEQNSNKNQFNQILLDLCFNHLNILNIKRKQQYKTKENYQNEMYYNQYFQSDQCYYYSNLVTMNILTKTHIVKSIQFLTLLIQYSPATNHSLKQSLIQYIVSLIKSKDQKLKKAVIEFLQVFTIHCSNTLIDYLLNLNILDAIDQILNIEQGNIKINMNNPNNSNLKYQQQIANCLTFILCNLFSSVNEYYLRQYYKHPILQRIFNYIQPYHPFLIMCRVFNFYIKSFNNLNNSNKGNISTKQYLPVLQAIIDSAKFLDPKERETQIVYQVIKQAYIRSVQNKSIKQAELIQNKLMISNLLSIIEDID